MANKHLFDTRAAHSTSNVPVADTVNLAGGVAYEFTPRHALAQYATTGCLNDTYYADAKTQLLEVLNLCKSVDPEFIGKTAVYARQGHMKDMPALLCCALAARPDGLDVLARVFPIVMDSGKMIRNFCQVIRSGQVGRKSFGRALKRLIRSWLSRQTDDGLFRQSVGNDPSIADVIAMVHPKPANRHQEALYAYLLGKETGTEPGKLRRRYLPALIKQYEAFKDACRDSRRAADMAVIPDVPFQMLASLDIGPAVWTEIARNASWQTTRMNLNTFARHDVFKQPDMIGLLAARLRDPEEVKRARVFPYQLLVAFLNTDESVVPREIRDALQDAMELAVSNVPVVDGQVYVLPDVSGSMRSAVTGTREGATSKVRCVDVAALVAASFLRRNPKTVVVPFEQDVVDLPLNARDSIMTNAEKLASVGGGGTCCSAPLALLNRQGARGDLVVYCSDNESWINPERDQLYANYWGGRGGSGTSTMQEWQRFHQRNPQARLVCIDVTPNRTTQATGKDHPEILNVGGFGDQVFDVIRDFCQGDLGPGRWVQRINEIVLPEKA
jgi:60 kDa SS-A/Ro ribonucleoprotein